MSSSRLNTEPGDGVRLLRAREKGITGLLQSCFIFPYSDVLVDFEIRLRGGAEILSLNGGLVDVVGGCRIDIPTDHRIGRVDPCHLLPRSGLPHLSYGSVSRSTVISYPGGAIFRPWSIATITSVDPNRIALSGHSTANNRWSIAWVA